VADEDGDEEDAPLTEADDARRCVLRPLPDDDGVAITEVFIRLLLRVEDVPARLMVVLRVFSGLGPGLVLMSELANE